MNPRRSDRQELQRRLDQARRLVTQTTDPQTAESLTKLISEIEADIRKAVGGAEV
jgi:hypothetical protein